MAALTKDNAFATELEKAEEQLDISAWMREYLAFHVRCSAESKADGRIQTISTKR
jgi:hypothetical protein